MGKQAIFITVYAILQISQKICQNRIQIYIYSTLLSTGN